jgi:dephospho-CoA kinase
MKIAITGGIGSGKSTVAQYFREQGFNVFSCDKIYSDLLREKSFLNKLEKAFGDILDREGNLDRKKLGEIVFGDREKLKQLDGITHPEIMKRAIELMEGHDVSFCEVPLLFEGGFEKLFDKVVVVLRDRQKRAEAVSLRDGISIESANTRIDSQFNYDQINVGEYMVVKNDGNLEDLRAQCRGVLDTVLDK